MTKGEINYKNGKIYKIEPICDHDEGDVYIGSTTKQYLSQRMTAHRDNYKRYKNDKHAKTMSFDLFDKYGIENCDIILLELVEASSKDELHTREAYYIKATKCVNKYIPMRTIKEYRKQYRHDNKEHLKIKIVCQCGSEFRKNDKARHERTKKHIEFIRCLPSSSDPVSEVV